MSKVRKPVNPTPKNEPTSNAKKSASIAVDELENGYNPIDDAFIRKVPVDFQIRAGLKDYARETQERLQDVVEQKHRVFYQLPITISGKLYELLLRDMLNWKRNCDWTEQNHVELILNRYLTENNKID